MNRYGVAPTLTPARTWWIASAVSLSIIIALLTGQWWPTLILPLLMLHVASFIQTRLFHMVLLFFIPLSIELQVSPSLGTDLPDEVVMWLLCIPITGTILWRNAKSRMVISMHSLFRILLVQIMWVAVTIIFSKYPILSVKYLLAKCWYIIPFAGGAVLFLDSKERREKIALVLICAMLLSSLFVVSRHAMNAFTFDSVNAAARPLFRNHVNYSALLVCMIPVAVAGAFISVKWRPLFICITLFWISALFFTYSRGAWIALPIGVLITLAIRYHFLKWVALAGTLTIIVVIFSLANDNRYLDHKPDYDQTIYHSDLSGHLQATYHLRDLSTAERLYRWIAAIRMMDGHWIVGHGPNSFYPEYRSYTVNMFRTYVSDNPEKSTVHNYFLLLLTEQGIPGLALFLLLLGVLFNSASKAYHLSSSREDRITVLTISCILGMIFTLISLSDLIETDKIGSLFYTCVGILALMSFSEKKVDKEHGLS